MRRGRLLIFLGLILGIGAAVIVLLVLTQQQAPPVATPQPSPLEAPPTGVPTQKVWIALQPIKRGGEFTEGTLGLRDWPTSNVPPDVIGDAAETIGRVASTDVVQGMPILRGMMAEKGASGQAALQVPPGRVAVAFPINEQSSVGYAIQAGDYVDVLIIASFIDLDPDFQTKLPNYIRFFTTSADKETGQVTFSLLEQSDEGRFERPPGLPPEVAGAIVYPHETQRPRRVAQLTVPAAKVLRIGPWIEKPAPAPAAGAEGEAQAPAPPPLPTIITVAVDPQDALVLLWARKSEMYMELALRASNEENGRYQPEAVTLQYMLTRFQISVPPKLEYGFEREAFMEPVAAGPTPQSAGN
jgi:Flp pilus assembly protein CpaB